MYESDDEQSKREIFPMKMFGNGYQYPCTEMQSRLF